MAGRQNWRRGKGKVPGSGRTKLFDEKANVTIAVEQRVKAAWTAFAKENRMTVGEAIRQAMSCFVLESHRIGDRMQ